MNGNTLHHIIGIALLVLFAVGDWYLIKQPKALRDTSTATNKPYSFSRVQLWWWTNVVIIGFIMIYLLTGDLPNLNDTCLALMGIGLGTTAAGRIVDGHDTAQDAADRHQNDESKTFFVDILSDKAGVSIHRFQALVFNVIYGVSFVILVIRAAVDGVSPDSYFPTYNAATLGLLLGSASGYLVVKTRENAETAPKPQNGP